MRSDGSSAGKWDVYVQGLGRRFRSRKELERFIEESQTTGINPEEIDFTVWGKGNR